MPGGMWFLLGGLVPGMTGGKGVMAGGQTDWFVLRPSLFIGILPGTDVDAPGPVRWLADRRAALLPFVFFADGVPDGCGRMGR